MQLLTHCIVAMPLHCCQVLLLALLLAVSSHAAAAAAALPLAQVLYLHKNKFSGTLPLGFKDMASLRDLTLNENAFTGADSMH